jgi:hypothetical protein
MKPTIKNNSAGNCENCLPGYKNRDSTLKCKLCILLTYPEGSKEAIKIIEQMEEKNEQIEN